MRAMAVNTADYLSKKLLSPLKESSRVLRAAYEAGEITREEWHRQDPMAVLVDAQDAEYWVLRKKIDRELHAEHQKNQAMARAHDRARGRHW